MEQYLTREMILDKQKKIILTAVAEKWSRKQILEALIELNKQGKVLYGKTSKDLEKAGEVYEHVEDRPGMTFREIGNEMGISHNRVRGIVKALPENFTVAELVDRKAYYGNKPMGVFPRKRP